MQRDTPIFDLITQEKWRQTKGLELIASENYVSDQGILRGDGFRADEQVRGGLPGTGYYGGCEFVVQVDNFAEF